MCETLQGNSISSGLISPYPPRYSHLIPFLAGYSNIFANSRGRRSFLDLSSPGCRVLSYQDRKMMQCRWETPVVLTLNPPWNSLRTCVRFIKVGRWLGRFWRGHGVSSGAVLSQDEKICRVWDLFILAPILRRRHPSKYQFLALMNVLIILGPWQWCPVYPISSIHPISLLIIFGLLEVPGHLVIVEACHTSSSWKPGGAGSFPFRDIGSPILVRWPRFVCN